MRSPDSNTRTPAGGRATARIAWTSIALLSSLCTAQAEEPDGWVFGFTPYIWAADISADTTARGVTGSTEASFGDILDHLDMAVMGRFEAWKDESWGAYWDAVYMDLGSSYSTPSALISTDMDLTMGMLDLGLGAKVWKHEGMAFDLLAGARWVSLDGNIAIRAGGPLDGLGLGSTYARTETWIEPVLGGRLRYRVNPDLEAALRFDFGGFGLDGCSDLSWNVVVGIERRLSDTLSIKAGYRIFGLNYQTGSGNTRFGIDGQFSGPIAGLTFVF